MAKLIGLFSRKSGTSLEEFRDYYETRHAPFAVRHFGHLFASYTRNYVTPDTEPGGGSRIDVVTEIVFPDDASMAAMFAMTREDPSLQQAIAEDEANFMDPEFRQVLLVHDADQQSTRGIR
ncbi:EthD domain-containing protein [Nocardioides sp. JQ2195]|uniref:EthD domain-containing protein n=1 Tax=Nocardioides sp. JQ2195 TaxID=2592334 RepID=UPI00143E1DB4|nr:EthD domain-containing protein [Nocardioides sp. JQ2195]QIX26484.1 EthD domain-containing protein [Nocardioides sp. JQ2195]